MANDVKPASEIFDKQIHANELKLRILMTDGCNRAQRCSFCLNDFQPKPKNGMQFLNQDIAKMAISQYANLFTEKYPLQVSFSGGEPTLHPNLIDVMKFAKSLDCLVALNTNGIFSNSLEVPLMLYSDKIHFGTYEKNSEHAERVRRMGGLIQCIYPHIDQSFIEFYLRYGLPIKIFEDFNNVFGEYVKFAREMIQKFPSANLSFRYTGIQENRGPGCNGCEKICCTLKGAWIFSDGGTSPCPQLYKYKKHYPQNKEEWIDYLKEVEAFHKIN
jgi:organic radical activating enzyme